MKARLTWLKYQSEPLGLIATASYNVFGDRISAISVGGTPNIYERSRPMGSMVVSKRIGQHLTAKASADNIFDPAYKNSHMYKGQEFIYTSYKLGRTYSLGVTYLIN